MSNLRNRVYIASFDDNYIEAIKDYELGMEINITCISEMLDDESEKREKLLSDISRDIEETGAKRLILHGPFTEIIPAGIDRHMREAALVRLNQAYDVCRKLGIKKMIVHNGWIPFMYFKSWQASEAPKFWEGFMADKPDDFEIAIENVLEDEPFMLAEMMGRIKDPRIKLCLDIGHANAACDPEFPVDIWIKILSPYISHLHLHNNYGGGKDDHASFEEGNLNMEEIFELFDQYLGDEVTYTVEAHDCISCLEWMLERRII